ncbi:MAG: hypothetical protein FWC20_06760 [Oscillospiraceae bacterium]|nr:hypothetical protein [Oscillospiraceae bacterium]MCL2279091.1 hypothetical protein [Oscillospiraceae bacterium]
MEYVIFNKQYRVSVVYGSDWFMADGVIKTKERNRGESPLVPQTGEAWCARCCIGNEC